MGDINITDLYKDLMPKVYRFVWFKLRNQEDTEDAVSEVFLRFVQTNKDYNNSGEAKAWLFGITHKVLLEKYRENYKFSKVDFVDEDIHDNESMENITLDKTTIEKISEFLRNLGEPYLGVITLRLWEEMEFTKISESLGMSLSNTKMTFYRGIGKLKEMIDKTEEGKKLRSVAVLPILVSAMNVFNQDTKYKPTEAFSKSLFNQIENMNISKFKNLTKTQILVSGLAVIAVAVISILFVVSILNNKKDGTNPQPQASQPVSSPESTNPKPTNPYEGWIKYTSDEFGIEFFHPQNYVVKNTAAGLNVELKNGKTRDNEDLTIVEMSFSYRPMTYAIDENGVFTPDNENPDFAPVNIEGKPYFFKSFSMGEGVPCFLNGQILEGKGAGSFKGTYITTLNEGLHLSIISTNSSWCNENGDQLKFITSKEDIEIGRKILESIVSIGKFNSWVTNEFEIPYGMGVGDNRKLVMNVKTPTAAVVSNGQGGGGARMYLKGDGFDLMFFTAYEGFAFRYDAFAQNVVFNEQYGQLHSVRSMEEGYTIYTNSLANNKAGEGKCVTGGEEIVGFCGNGFVGSDDHAYVLYCKGDALKCNPIISSIKSTLVE